jgi:hypothetical protein
MEIIIQKEHLISHLMKINSKKQTVQQLYKKRISQISKWRVLFWKICKFMLDSPRAGFKNYTDQSLSTLLSTNPKTGEYILLLDRLIGAFNMAIAVSAIAIVLTAFRRGEAWSWFALLACNTIGYISQ